MQIGSFGGTVFEVSDQKVLTYNNFKQESSAKFAEHDVIGQVSKLEFLKRESEKISFDIKFAADLGVDVEEEIKTLREMCASGEADFFIIGNEVSDIEWVIENISVTAKFYFGDGTLRAAEVSLSLREYN